jgi:hypothetical protein
MNLFISYSQVRLGTKRSRLSRGEKSRIFNEVSYVWSDNKVRELAIVCLPWQQWTQTSVWFDDVGISVFRSMLFFIYSSLFLSGVYYCLNVFWCAVARMSERTLNVLLGRPHTNYVKTSIKT